MIPTNASAAGRRAAAIVLVLAGLCAAFAPGCAKKPIVRLRGIQIDHLGLSEVDLLLGFEVTNPNWFTVRLFEFEYELAVDGQRIAGGEMSKPIRSIGAEKTESYSVPVTLTYESMLPFVTRHAGRDAIGYELTTRATFNVLGMPIPIRKKRVGKIPPIRKPSIRLKTVRMRKEPPKAIEVVFEVHNPNRFALLLEHMEGGVFAGEEQILTIWRSETTKFPGGKTSELVVPVRLGVAAMVRAVAKAVGKGRKLQFKGKFVLDAPGPIKNIFTDEDPSP